MQDSACKTNRRGSGVPCRVQLALHNQLTCNKSVTSEKNTATIFITPSLICAIDIRLQYMYCMGFAMFNVQSSHVACVVACVVARVPLACVPLACVHAFELQELCKIQ